MRQILSVFVVLLFVTGCGGGEEIDLPDFEPVETPEQREFTPDFDPSDYGDRLADADYVPDEIVSLFVDSFSSNSAKARIIEQIRENVPCFRGFGDDTDEEIWDDLVGQFLGSIENWGGNLEEAVRNVLAANLYIEPDTSAESVWGEIADEIGGC